MNHYRHTVHYYETDKMSITHHSNYIRWMEEARVYYLSQIGCGYDKMEEEGIVSPVVSVSCSYRKSTTFADEIEIRVRIKEFKGIKLIVEYEMINLKNDSVVCTAQSEHCFLNSENKPVNLKKLKPEYYERLTANIT